MLIKGQFVVKIDGYTGLYYNYLPILQFFSINYLYPKSYFKNFLEEEKLFGENKKISQIRK